jgi:hypothetical protein
VKAGRFIRKAEAVDAILLTKENMEDVAKLYDIAFSDIGGPHITFWTEFYDEVDVSPGNWLVRDSGGDICCMSHDRFMARHFPVGGGEGGEG